HKGPRRRPPAREDSRRRLRHGPRPRRRRHKDGGRFGHPGPRPGRGRPLRLAGDPRGPLRPWLPTPPAHGRRRPSAALRHRRRPLHRRLRLRRDGRPGRPRDRHPKHPRRPRMRPLRRACVRRRSRRRGRRQRPGGV
ncbi:MAG: Ribose 5-phosphate isomerase A, partial [uncultured Rubrobacteraceae bacterium]